MVADPETLGDTTDVAVAFTAPPGFGHFAVITPFASIVASAGLSTDHVTARETPGSASKCAMRLA
jgi:hypothetical protein